MHLKSLAAAAAVLMIGSGAHAAEMVSNGGFESSSYTSNTQFGAGFGGQGVTDWVGLGGNNLQFYYDAATATTVNAVNQFNDPGGEVAFSFTGASPDGGHFVALDGDSDYFGQVSQTVNGLTVGHVYTLNFYWAASQLQNRSGPTTDKLRVSFGGETYDTNVLAIPNQGFSGWQTQTHAFTATSVSQVLTFMAIGTPNGLPPVALLDGISLTGSVPEPAAWALMIMGFAGIGSMIRRRRVLTAA